MLTNEELLERQRKELIREQIEHRDVLTAIATIIKTKEGLQLFGYLFKHFEATNLPDRGMEGNDLHDYLGFLRAGNAIYKLACEADSETAASLIAKMERQRYEHLYEQYRLENS